MGAPKSVIKVDKKGGVRYESNCDKCQYYMHELTRAALRDVAKFVAKNFRISFYQKFKRHTGKAGRVTKYVVYASKSTTAPRVDIGLKTGKVDGFYAYFQEVGTLRQPKLGLLRNTVEKNVDEIVKIESRYLTGLESEARARELAMSEANYEGGE